MTFDENYGAFLLTMSPLNIIVLPFVPLSLVRKPSVKLNSFVTLLQYMIFIFAILIIFLIGNAILTPFAFVQSLFIKFKKFMRATALKAQIMTLCEFTLYAALGLPAMFLNMIADLYYFGVNNFRNNLKKIIIERKKSTLTNLSIRNIRDYSNKYIYHKIKSVYTREAVVSFRQNYSVLDSLQFLIFGQFTQIGINSFSNIIELHGGGTVGTNIKKLKTSNLKHLNDQRRQKQIAE